MRTLMPKNRRIAGPRGQRGVVLFITLIILVAMTLAGIGMMRSVDTGSIIAGNLAFRQATSNASDDGPNLAFNALMSVANTNNGNDKNILDFNNGQPCPAGATPSICAAGANINLPGYSSTPLAACEVTRTCINPASYSWWSVAANWNGTPSVDVLGPNGGTIATVNYVIHRMCQTAGVGPNDATQLGCQVITQPATGCSLTQKLPCESTSVFYRITTRSMGTRNSLVYAQTLVLIPE